MRKRFQKGSLQKVRGEWVARWRQDGERKARMLGRVSQMTKAQAQSELAAILAPINSARSEPSEQRGFGDFVRACLLAVLPAKVEALDRDDQRGSPGTSFNVRVCPSISGQLRQR